MYLWKKKYLTKLMYNDGIADGIMMVLHIYLLMHV